MEIDHLILLLSLILGGAILRLIDKYGDDK